MRYVKGLDTLRTLAVFYVILEHWGPTFQEHTGKAYAMQALFRDGTFGVNLFFVLSGFLITSILLNEKSKNPDTDGKFTVIKNFFVRRFLRIFPIYYLFIVLCFVLGYQFVRENIWYYLTYTSNIIKYRLTSDFELSHTWSLAVEEQFYLIWPWLIIFINKKYLKHVLIVSILIGIISKYVVLYVYHHKHPSLVFNWFDSFGIGGLYAYIRQEKERYIRFEQTFRLIFPFLLYLAWRTSGFGGAPLIVIFYKTIDNLTAIALIMFILNNKNEWVRKYVLENTFFNFMGKISYGIYLYHLFIGGEYNGLVSRISQKYPSFPSIFSNFYFAYGIKFVLLIIVCWLSYKFIEEPIIKLKKKFEYSGK